MLPQITILPRLPRALDRLTRPQSLSELNYLASVILEEPETFRRLSTKLGPLLLEQAKQLVTRPAELRDLVAATVRFADLLAYYSPTIPKAMAAMWALAESEREDLAQAALERLSSIDTVNSTRLVRHCLGLNWSQTAYIPHLIPTALSVFDNKMPWLSSAMRQKVALTVLASPQAPEYLVSWLSDPRCIDLYDLPQLVPFVTSTLTPAMRPLLAIALTDMPSELRSAYAPLLKTSPNRLENTSGKDARPLQP